MIFLFSGTSAKNYHRVSHTESPYRLYCLNQLSITNFSGENYFPELLFQAYFQCTSEGCSCASGQNWSLWCSEAAVNLFYAMQMPENQCPGLGEKMFLKKLYETYNLLKHLEEWTIKNNFSGSLNILFDTVLDQTNVLDVSLFACFPQMIKL